MQYDWRKPSEANNTVLSDLLDPYRNRFGASGGQVLSNFMTSSSGGKANFQSQPYQAAQPEYIPSYGTPGYGGIVGMGSNGTEYYSGSDPEAFYRQYMYKQGFGDAYDRSMGY